MDRNRAAQDDALGNLTAAAVGYLRAKRAAYEYGVNMPAQTPAPERFAFAEARDAARDHLVFVAEEYAKAATAEAGPADVT